MEKLYIVNTNDHSTISTAIVRQSMLEEECNSFFDGEYEKPESWDIDSETTIETEMDTYLIISPITGSDIDTIKDVIINANPNVKYIAWGTDDIISHLKDHEIYLNEDYAIAALDTMIENHDCNYGITWDNVSYCGREQVPSMFSSWTSKGAIVSPDNIQTFDDIAHFFFQLTTFHKIAYHPDTPFSDYINSETRQPTFSESVCQNMDSIMDKCYEVFNKENVNLYSKYADIYELCIHIDNTISEYYKEEVN